MTDAGIFTAIKSRLVELDALQADPSGIRSPRLTTTGGSRDPGRVPFGVDHRIDDPDGGIDGLRTSAAIRSWAAHWALHIADLRREKVHTTNLDYLAATADWAAHEWAGWANVAAQADAILARLDRLTGHTPQPDPGRHCPACGSTMVRGATDHGLTDEVVCTHCGETYTDDEHADLIRRWRIRTSSEPIWADLSTITRIHGPIDHRTINSWVRRGRVHRDARGRYRLDEINHMLRRRAA